MNSVSGESTLMTAEELLRLPGGERRYELVRGELRQMTPSGLMRADEARMARYREAASAWASMWPGCHTRSRACRSSTRIGS